MVLDYNQVFPDLFNRNRNLGISRAPLKSEAQQGTSLLAGAAMSKWFVQRVVHDKLRSDSQRVRGDIVAIKAGVV